ncbi:MAG: four helix bundle protein [bacterium]|nr:four helix bundle protein [bacterium]
MDIKSYKDLIVWQKAMELVSVVYRVTDKFPKVEMYGLTSQMRRSAISIPSNIAEGRRRSSRKDFRNFLLTAYGSGAELETQVEIAKRIHIAPNADYTQIDELLLECMRMLNKLIANLQPNS